MCGIKKLLRLGKDNKKGTENTPWFKVKIINLWYAAIFFVMRQGVVRAERMGEMMWGKQKMMTASK